MLGKRGALAYPAFAMLLCVQVSGVLAAPSLSVPARASHVRETRHNLSTLSSAATRDVQSTDVNQLCVFCHTPHAATTRDAANNVILPAPLWNKVIPAQTAYTGYVSDSLDATAGAPGGSSKLCLSCHDGTLAVGNMNVYNTVVGFSATMTGPAQSGGKLSGVSETGFSTALGQDLRNDHPISIAYTDTLVSRDTELRRLTNVVDARIEAASVANNVSPPRDLLGTRASGYRPLLPLENGQVQCATCHDPHQQVTNEAASGNQKFLRLNRFQQASPDSVNNQTFDYSKDIICLACHDKDRESDGKAASWRVWSESAHANPGVANEEYDAAKAGVAQRGFPANLAVWQAGCLNCHDAHTAKAVTASGKYSRLLREGCCEDSGGLGAQPNSPKSSGFARAIEETCYQCHRNSAGSILANATPVPDIRSEFRTPNAVTMPITGDEKHEIGIPGTTGAGADFLEQPALLGVGNRHVECTDCHNPHRVRKSQQFNNTNANEAKGTHVHDETGNVIHNNLASGVLRGGTGVEPRYADLANTSFHNILSAAQYDAKRGDIAFSGAGTTGVTEPYVTREYQVCLRCHSSYAYGSSPPALQASPPGTPVASANGLTAYTDQAKEFRPAHLGDISTVGQIAGTNLSQTGSYKCFVTNSDTTNCGWNQGTTQFNYRSFHPVIGVTGRTQTVRGGGGTYNLGDFRKPWSNTGALGAQTMYCTDCHGPAITTGGTSIPTPTTDPKKPWGPHGSANPFILKGTWSQNTGTNQTGTDHQDNGLCFKCHDYTTYAAGARNRTGFFLNNGNDGHTFHFEKIGRMRCSWCHVAVPHGWKNKALLVNLNDVGPEVGLTEGTEVRAATTAGYTKAPYYLNAMNKIRQFARSGNWQAANCGSSGRNGGNGQSGRDWMRDSSENCKSPP